MKSSLNKLILSLFLAASVGVFGQATEFPTGVNASGGTSTFANGFTVSGGTTSGIVASDITASNRVGSKSLTSGLSSSTDILKFQNLVNGRWYEYTVTGFMTSPGGFSSARADVDVYSNGGIHPDWISGTVNAVTAPHHLGTSNTGNTINYKVIFQASASKPDVYLRIGTVTNDPRIEAVAYLVERYDIVSTTTAYD